MWSMFYITDSIPELKDEPYRITMHILAEIVTGVVLIIGALGLIKNYRWRHYVYPFSMGMLMYTLIVSPGYYIQKDVIAFVVMFAVLFLITIIILIKFYHKEIKDKKLG